MLRYLTVGRQLGYAFYIGLDNLTYLDFANIRKFKGAARLQKEAYRAWVAGLLCNILAGLYRLYHMRAEARGVKGSADAEKTVQLKKLEK